MARRSSDGTEAEVKRAILAAFGSRDDLLWENTPVIRARSLDGSRFLSAGTPGQADLRCLWRRDVWGEFYTDPPGRRDSMIGQAVAVETKRSRGGVQSKAQKRWQRAWEARGGIYILARSVDDVAAVLGPPEN